MSEADLARLAADRERVEALQAREREVRESVRRRSVLAKWLPASANGYLNLVPGVTGSMLVSPGVEYEAEVSVLSRGRDVLLMLYQLQTS